jgi:hypothetical protein
MECTTFTVVGPRVYSGSLLVRVQRSGTSQGVMHVMESMDRTGDIASARRCMHLRFNHRLSIRRTVLPAQMRRGRH